ncbi:MAG: YkvA family protein [Solirubrobacterales bacterium]
MNIKERASKLKADIPAVFIALRKKDTPIAAKIFAAIAIGYVLSPIDLIPDFIPVIGMLDDVIIVPVLVALTLKLIPEEVLKECRKDAVDLWNNGKPKKWYFSIPIICIWILLLLMAARLFIK